MEEEKRIIRTCEERVIAELEDAEKEIAALKESKAQMEQTLQYADGVLGILKQIVSMEKVAVEGVEDPVYHIKADANISGTAYPDVVKMLGGLFMKKGGTGEDEGRDAGAGAAGGASVAPEEK